MAKWLLVFCAIAAVALANLEVQRKPRKAQYNPQFGSYAPLAYGYGQPYGQQASANAQAQANAGGASPLGLGVPYGFGGNQATAQASVGTNNPGFGVYPQNNLASLANANANARLQNNPLPIY